MMAHHYALQQLHWNEYISMRGTTPNVQGIPKYYIVCPDDGRVIIWPRLESNKHIPAMTIVVEDKGWKRDPQ